MAELSQFADQKQKSANAYIIILAHENRSGRPDLFF
jgi:hypothetical protein